MTDETSSLSCEQLEERLAALHQASLELVQDISVDSLLERIARIACDQVDATYAAIGVQGEDGQIYQFITVGMSDEDVAKIAHPPVGLGLIGLIAKSDGPLRVDSIQKDPRSAGFPEGHPNMTSLLGVPIRLGSHHLGQIYLTDKRDGDRFTTDDERVIVTLAAYAAVAISNAHSYRELRERDRTLTRRNQDLALLNNLASALASITELDELLKTALNRVMIYFNLDVGEIYLSEENQNILNKTLHQGEIVPTLWTQDRFTRKESLIGQTARTGQPAQVSLPYKEDSFLLNEELTQAGIRRIACFPLTSRSEVLGVLSIATHQADPLDAMDEQLLSSIASWVGTTIENSRLNIQGRRLAVLEERDRIGMDLA